MLDPGDGRVQPGGSLGRTTRDEGALAPPERLMGRS